ncbi:MAG: dockerin type I repeat-containing protein [candidate division Zixibacteria bacterium]|nr:dockerin type I repeat-containing protein [candidate division Zixibacteria bacterium]
MIKKKLIGQILLLAGIITVTITFVMFNLKAQTEKIPSNKKEPPRFGELRIVNEGDAFLLKPAGYFSYYNHLNSAGDYKDYEFVTGEGVFACTLSNIPVWSDYDLYLLDCKKEIIASSENGGNYDEYISKDVPIGLYYVRVYCFSGGNPTQNYHLFGQSPDQTIAPDFRILSITASDSNPIVGSYITLKLTVVNFSPCTTSTFYTSLFQNRDTPPTAPNCQGQYNFFWGQLGSFEQHEFIQYYVTSYTATTWQVYGLVDCDNSTTELNECNNSYGPMRITWREPPPKPDLMFTNVTPSSVTPGVAKYDYLYTDVTIHNAGNASASLIWTDIFYDTTAAPVAPAIGNDYRYTSSLPVGNSNTFTFVTRNRSGNAESWDNYLLVDSPEWTDEQNENNNVYGPIHISWIVMEHYPQRTRDQIINTAAEFVNAFWQPSANNLYPPGECPNWRIDPLNNLGFPIAGEAYEWGAWDRPNDFLRLLNLKYNSAAFFKPGYRESLYCEPGGDPFWAIGSDCAGLVSRAWNLSYMCETECLTSTYVSNPLPNYDYKYLVRGDIVCWPDTHVALFYEWGDYDTMWVIEETPPRARLFKWPLQKYSPKYKPYRYKNVAGVPFIAGDANSDGIVSVGDVIWLINYLFKHGPPPQPLCKADVNADGRVTVADVVYLVSYLFKGGPDPLNGCA